MTRDEAIELSGFLYRTLSSGIAVSFFKNGEHYVEVAYPDFAHPTSDTYILDEIASERGLELRWHHRYGELIATYLKSSLPIRHSFAELTQDELDTCFEVAFGNAAPLSEVNRNGGVKGYWYDSHPQIKSQYTQLYGKVDDGELSISFFEKGYALAQARTIDGTSEMSVRMFSLHDYLKSINVDFGF